VPSQFALDITRIRDDARAKMDQGAVTKDNTSDVDAVIDVLNQVVATEIVCWMRYTQHSIVASGIDRAQVAAEFTEHATGRPVEITYGVRGGQGHRPDEIARGEPGRRAHRHLLYQEIVRWLGDSDPTTRRMMESILEEEEEHADDLNDLLGN
jgi:bacterioferritin